MYSQWIIHLSLACIMFFVYVRPVSVMVPWFLRQYRRLLALLALAETEIAVMTAQLRF